MMSNTKNKQETTVIHRLSVTKRQAKTLVRSLGSAVTSLVLLLSGITAFAPAVAHADRFEEQIKRLQEQNNQTRAQDQLLETEAANLQAVVQRIQGDIDGVEKQITETKGQQVATEQKITEVEASLGQQKKLLGQNIRVSYIEGGMSSLEMLASSKNLSDYMDKEQYRISVQNKITETLGKIRDLKFELAKEKERLDKLAFDQTAMQTRLDAQRTEQQRLLTMNQDQQAAFESNLTANNAKIADLRRQQIAENSRFTGGDNVPDSSGYPWANVAFPNEISDPWGMYLRQCVSYTAWKVASSGRYMPYWGGYGNANQWDDNARAAGIPVNGNPKVGDVAISNRGYYGHSMYVEAVYGDGTILVSQYNASWDGKYSEARIAVGDLVFIHF